MRYPPLLIGVLGILIASGSIGLSGCVASPSRATPTHLRALPVSDDAEVFALVVQHLSTEDPRAGGSLRVDPRPLKPDPSIVELWPSLAKSIPDRVQAAPEPLAGMSPGVARRRSQVLARLNVSTTDAFAHPSCPGILLPPELQKNREPDRRCPKEVYTAAILSLPRPGGAYWPGNLDQRDDGSHTTWTVRVIRRNLEPVGAGTTALDYVVDHTCEGNWQIRKVVPLVIME